MRFIGIDPGVHGGIAVLSDIGSNQFTLETFKMPETLYEKRDFFKDFYSNDAVAVLEAVWPVPGLSASSTAKLVLERGYLEMALAFRGIPTKLVRAHIWQKAMGCLSKGDKRVTRDAAQRLFPNSNITHAVADAALLAEYGRTVAWKNYARTTTSI